MEMKMKHNVQCRAASQWQQQSRQTESLFIFRNIQVQIGHSMCEISRSTARRRKRWAKVRTIRVCTVHVKIRILCWANERWCDLYDVYSRCSSIQHWHWHRHCQRYRWSSFEQHNIRNQIRCDFYTWRVFVMANWQNAHTLKCENDFSFLLSPPKWMRSHKPNIQVVNCSVYAILCILQANMLRAERREQKILLFCRRKCGE